MKREIVLLNRRDFDFDAILSGQKTFILCTHDFTTEYNILVGHEYIFAETGNSIPITTGRTCNIICTYRQFTDLQKIIFGFHLLDEREVIAVGPLKDML